jgi:Aspartyl protease
MSTEESTHQDFISSEGAMPTQGVCTLNNERKKVFEHSEVAVRDRKEVVRIRVRRNHTKVQGDRAHVKEPFIIRERIVGHTVRIQIDSGSDLDCISERFVKRHNLPTRRHPDPVRVRGFNGELVGKVNRQLELPLTLGKVEVGRIKLDVVTTDVDAILGAGWLRRNRPQFGWGNNTLK